VRLTRDEGPKAPHPVIKPAPRGRKTHSTRLFPGGPGKAQVSQGYCQCPGSQTQFWPCVIHCPGTQVLIRWGGSSQCPAIHCQPLFQVQYPGTQTDADEGGMGMASWSGVGGGCGTTSWRTMTCGGAGGGAAGGDGAASALSGSAGGVSCPPPQATTKTSVIDARSVSGISVRFIVCFSLSRPEIIANAPAARPSSGLVASIALAPRWLCPAEVAPSVQPPTASRYSRTSIPAPRQTMATAQAVSFPHVAAGEARARRFALSRAARVLVSSER